MTEPTKPAAQRKPRRAPGTGMDPVWDSKRGAWRIDLDWGRRTDGRRWRPSVYHKDRATCIKNAKAKQREHDAEAGQTRPGSKSMTLSVLYVALEEHLDTLIDSGHMKPHTKRNKLGRLRTHVLPDYEQMRVVDVLPSTVERWLLKARNARTGAALPSGTKRKIWEAINDLFDVAVKDQIILAKDHPSRLVKGPKAPIRKVKVWVTREEAELLLKVATGSTRTGLMIMWTTTTRKITMLSLRWRNVDFDAGLIRPEVSKRRSGDDREPGVLVMNATLTRHLRSLGEHHPDEYVVPNAHDPFRPRQSSAFDRSYNLVAEQAGVVGKSPHKLRHGGVTELLATGADPETIREILDWTSIAMLDVYAHTDSQRKGAAMRALELGADEFGDEAGNDEN